MSPTYNTGSFFLSSERYNLGTVIIMVGIMWNGWNRRMVKVRGCRTPEYTHSHVQPVVTKWAKQMMIQNNCI